MHNPVIADDKICLSEKKTCIPTINEINWKKLLNFPTIDFFQYMLFIKVDSDNNVCLTL